MLECSPLGDIGGGGALLVSNSTPGGCSPVGGSVALEEQGLRHLKGSCAGGPVLHQSQGEEFSLKSDPAGLIYPSAGVTWLRGAWEHSTLVGSGM